MDVRAFQSLVGYLCTNYLYGKLTTPCKPNQTNESYL